MHEAPQAHFGGASDFLLELHDIRAGSATHWQGVLTELRVELLNRPTIAAVRSGQNWSATGKALYLVEVLIRNDFQDDSVS